MTNSYERTDTESIGELIGPERFEFYIQHRYNFTRPRVGAFQKNGIGWMDLPVTEFRNFCLGKERMKKSGKREYGYRKKEFEKNWYQTPSSVAKI
jgi:hypothetical protein